MFYTFVSGFVDVQCRLRNHWHNSKATKHAPGGAEWFASHNRYLLVMQEFQRGWGERLTDSLYRGRASAVLLSRLGVRTITCRASPLARCIFLGFAECAFSLPPRAGSPDCWYPVELINCDRALLNHHLPCYSAAISGLLIIAGHEPETVVGNPHIFLAPEAKADIPSPSNPARPVSPPGNVRSSVKRKPKIESGEQASRTSISPPLGRCEYINIGAHQDKLNLSVVEKLPSAVALAATSVHKYWTSSFGKAADTAEVTELMKLAEMYTSRSHVLNCELYKMLEMKVDEIHPVLGEDEDADAMRVGVKRLRARLAFSEDARTRTMYDVTKAQTIQKACIVAQKKAESQLKSCQSMIQAKDRELTEILNELAKAKGLLAKLGVSGYTVT
ncbi:hypothetical protein Fot_07653 [Forsythia ovata]|uniref:Uncharacterized protein n=1 Tax=Forsythia ovata TaxID=205694 RepID=A0ABD1WWK0_9LAMI